MKVEFNLTNLIPKAEFSYAIAVMYGIGGWDVRNELENWMGARFAACMWIHTEAVVCNGQRHMPTCRRNKVNSIVEAVNWECVESP